MLPGPQSLDAFNLFILYMRRAPLSRARDTDRRNGRPAYEEATQQRGHETTVTQLTIKRVKTRCQTTSNSGVT